MPEDFEMTRLHPLAAAVASLTLAGALTFSASTVALAQSPTEEEMLNALTRSAPKTRGLTVERTEKMNEERRFLDRVRAKSQTRQLTLDEREKLASYAKDKPKIDLEVYFDYNSSAITSEARPELMKLGRVLTNPDLEGSVFLLAGHTDAKGSDRYNQRLSERRAASVKRFLKRNFDISDDSLVAAGYGEEQLKNDDNPFASENRRVQIVNLEEKPVARR